jgi:hypothetical protein
MSLDIYRALHVAGLAMIMLAFGALLILPKEAPRPRSVMIMHGVGLLVMGVAGFGMMARMDPPIMAPDNWGVWLILKMIIWLAIGALPTLIKSGTIPRKVGWIVIVALAAVAAWLASAKPHFG